VTPRSSTRHPVLGSVLDSVLPLAQRNEVLRAYRGALARARREARAELGQG
jgi:hypothetical protein